MPGRKRKSAPSAPEAPPSRRRSTRISESGQKSSYFEAESPSEGDKNEAASRKAFGRGRPSTRAKAEVESDDDGDGYKNEEQASEKQDDESSDDELDEDAPPKVTFIPLPKLRDTGGIEYADDRLHPNTLAFLKDLKANNKRTWLKSHDAEYRRALKDWESYVTTLAEKIMAADPTIPELPFKDVNFRIYRDIRFSNDPTPYKAHFSAAFSRTGRKGPYACYYVHVEPGGACMVGGGLWHPDGPALARLRASIDERPARWRRVLNEPRFRETFLGVSSSSSSPASSRQKKGGRGEGKGRKGRVGKEGEEEDKDGGGGEEVALRAFAEKSKEGALKTRPKGFIPEHRDIALLKLRNFIVGKKVEDRLFTEARGQDGVARVVGDMVGFITHLNRIVMPDPGDDDESDEE